MVSVNFLKSFFSKRNQRVPHEEDNYRYPTDAEILADLRQTEDIDDMDAHERLTQLDWYTPESTCHGWEFKLALVHVSLFFCVMLYILMSVTLFNVAPKSPDLSVVLEAGEREYKSILTPTTIYVVFICGAFAAPTKWSFPIFL